MAAMYWCHGIYLRMDKWFECSEQCEACKQGQAGIARYPVPAIVAPSADASWNDVRWALRFFASNGGSGGINWTWAYFLNEQDATGFNLWCGRNGYETRGVYPPFHEHGYGVRYR
jgi:hypothetical protein